MEPIERIVSSVNAVSNEAVLSSVDIKRLCNHDLLCTARFIEKTLGPKSRLEKVRHPDTDSIRRVHNQSSLSGSKLLSRDTLHIVFSHLGRKTISEIENALITATKKNKGAVPKNIEIDLRDNRGGRFDRMINLAAAFIGPIPHAIGLTDKKGTRLISLPLPAKRFNFDAIKIIVGPKTASSAEVFAALLRVHGKAMISGKRTYGKNYLLHIIPIDHDRQLLVPGETISVPGTVLTGGIVPDER